MPYNLHPDLMPPDELTAAQAEAAACLRAAAHTLDQPHAWTRGCSARDKRGRPVAYTSPDAVSFCIFRRAGEARDR